DLRAPIPNLCPYTTLFRSQWPSALSATATHDTKRGEDVRARLNVLSEIPGAWKATVARWRTLNRKHKTEVHGLLAPDANEEYHRSEEHTSELQSPYDLVCR